MLFIVRTQVLGPLCTQVLCHLPQIYISSQAEHTQTKTTQDTLDFDKNLVLSSPDIWTLDWTVMFPTVAACSPHLPARLSDVTCFLLDSIFNQISDCVSTEKEKAREALHSHIFAKQS